MHLLANLIFSLILFLYLPPVENCVRDKVSSSQTKLDRKVPLLQMYEVHEAICSQFQNNPNHTVRYVSVRCVNEIEMKFFILMTATSTPFHPPS